MGALMVSRDLLSSGSHVVVVNGVEQCYHVAGSGPVCVVHSGGPGVHWDYLKMSRVEAHLTLIYLEPIGTGSSGRLPGHPRGYSVERFSRQLHGLLEMLELSRPFLLGHSHGGFVVQDYAIAHPTKVAGIILYASSAVTGGHFMAEASGAVEAFVQRHEGRPEAEQASNAWRSIPAISSDADCTKVMRDLLPVYFADYRRTDVPIEQLRSALRATWLIGDGEPFDVRSELPSLAIPTLILVGEHDSICGPRWASILHDAIPQAQLVRFPESGHFIHIEQPEEFAEAIARFANAVRLGA